MGRAVPAAPCPCPKALLQAHTVPSSLSASPKFAPAADVVPKAGVKEVRSVTSAVRWSVPPVSCSATCMAPVRPSAAVAVKVRSSTRGTRQEDGEAP